LSNPQLTVKQFAMLALARSSPPWHLGNLLKTYKQDFLPLKSTIADLSSTQVVQFVALRMASVIAPVASPPIFSEGGTNLENLWIDIWSSSAVQKSDIETFESILKPVGASIVYLSPYIKLPPDPSSSDSYLQAGYGYIPAWVTVGFAGTFGGLASLQSEVFPFQPSQWTSDQQKTIAGLTNGVMITNAGAVYTTCPMVNYPSSSYTPLCDPNIPLTFPPQMIYLSGGNANA
jgi:hypothetical protein